MRMFKATALRNRSHFSRLGNKEFECGGVPPDHIIADDKIIDLNKQEKPERFLIPREGELVSMRQAPPWYTAHYQSLTQGLDEIDYSSW